MSKSSTPSKKTYESCGCSSSTVALSFLIVTTALILGAIIFYGSRMSDREMQIENKDLQLQVRDLKNSIDRLQNSNGTVNRFEPVMEQPQE